MVFETENSKNLYGHELRAGCWRVGRWRGDKGGKIRKTVIA